MTRSTAITTIAIAALGVATARAQQPMRLTLDEAIQTALANNDALAISRLGIDAADEQVREAYANVYPTVSVNARYTRNLKKQVFFFPGDDGVSRPISIGSDNAVTADLSVNQILFNSAVFTGVGTAEVYAKISRQQLRTEAVQTVFNVKRAYYTALLARQALDVNRGLLTNAEENYRVTQALYKGGLRAEFDAIRAEVQVANQRPIVVQAEDNYRTALDNLRLVMGVDSDRPLEVEGDLVRPVSGSVEPAVATARTLLLQYNPQLRSLELNAEVNRQLIDIKRSDYMPTLSLFGAWQYQAQADGFSDFSFQPTAYVGLNLSLNLFNGGATSSQVEQARVAYEQSRLRFDQTRDMLQTRLDAVLRTLEYARQRIEAGGRTIEQADKGYRIATASYKAGTGTQLQINDADLALAQARLNQLSAVYDYNVAVAELESLLGEHVQLTEDARNATYSYR